MSSAGIICQSEPNYLAGLYQQAGSQRVPIFASFELTHRCNLRCVHCCHDSGCLPHANKEKTTPFWQTQIKNLVDKGCLNLLITGGEPLLRSDFVEIYQIAKMSGLLVTVFTNGTLITDEHLDLFGEFPPRAVEITLYGASAETYEAVTGKSGSFSACLHGIESLLSRGVRVKLKTVLLSLNVHEYDAIQKMAGKFGVPFRMDAAISPRFSGDLAPTELRVDPKVAVALEMASPKIRQNMAEYFDNCQGRALSGKLYECRAGQSSLNIDPHGFLQSCLLHQDRSYDLSSQSLEAAWDEMGQELAKKTRNPDSDCLNCELKLLCGNCPPYALLDSTSEQGKSDYQCAIANARFASLGNIKENMYESQI